MHSNVPFKCFPGGLRAIFSLEPEGRKCWDKVAESSTLNIVFFAATWNPDFFKQQSFIFK